LPASLPLIRIWAGLKSAECLKSTTSDTYHSKTLHNFRTNPRNPRIITL
jgi:hypothetical protein